jgi:hypothetical protein
MRLLRACLCLCPSLLVMGCDSVQPKLVAVTPAQAYSDQDTPLVLEGEGFLPSRTVDPTSGRSVAFENGFGARVGKGEHWVSLRGLAWQSSGHMTGTLPGAAALGSEALEPGSLDVELTDPRGTRSLLPDGFVNLGHDIAAPSVEFTTPHTSAELRAGQTIQASFHAADVPPGLLSRLEWRYRERGAIKDRGSCFGVTDVPEATCSFQVSIDSALTTGNVVELEAWAFDDVGNMGHDLLQIPLAALPTVASISPTSGGTAGGTDVIIKGTGFLPGSQVLFDGVLLFPDGGIVVDPQTISAHVPAHAPGGVSLTIATPLGQAIGTAVFTYVNPPLITSITPTSGPGGTAVSIVGKYFTDSTQFYFGKTLAAALPLADFDRQSDNAVIGRVPPGQGSTAVWAYDPAFGFTHLADGFTWEAP